MMDRLAESQQYENEIRELMRLTGWSAPHAQHMAVTVAREYGVALFAAVRVLQALAREDVLPVWMREGETGGGNSGAGNRI